MSLDLDRLDLAYLAQFLGARVNELVTAAIHEAGFAGLRESHGYVFQHLLGGPQSVGELARALGVSQQAASKVVGELVELGYVEVTASDDARVRRVALSARGLAAVKKARSARSAIDQKLRRAHGDAAVDAARSLLVASLERLGGADAVRGRRVRPPR